MVVKTHEGLEAWQGSIGFVAALHGAAKSFRKEENFGLTSPTRRLAVLVPSNITEGSAGKHGGEFRQFFHAALGSAAELDTRSVFARKLEYLNQQDYLQFSNAPNSISPMLQGQIRSIKTRKSPITNH